MQERVNPSKIKLQTLRPLNAKVLKGFQSLLLNAPAWRQKTVTTLCHTKGC